jgi:hypothetical protein
MVTCRYWRNVRRRKKIRMQCTLRHTNTVINMGIKDDKNRCRTNCRRVGLDVDKGRGIGVCETFSARTTLAASGGGQSIKIMLRWSTNSKDRMQQGITKVPIAFCFWITKPKLNRFSWNSVVLLFKWKKFFEKTLKKLHVVSLRYGSRKTVRGFDPCSWSKLLNSGQLLYEFLSFFNML